MKAFVVNTFAEGCCRRRILRKDSRARTPAVHACHAGCCYKKWRHFLRTVSSEGSGAGAGFLRACASPVGVTGESFLLAVYCFSKKRGFVARPLKKRHRQTPLVTPWKAPPHCNLHSGHGILVHARNRAMFGPGCCARGVAANVRCLWEWTRWRRFPRR